MAGSVLHMFSRIVLSTLLTVSGSVALSSGCGGHTPVVFSPPGPLNVSSVVPSTGPTDAASTVRVFGTGFEPGVTVSLGGPATNVSLANSSMINATVPPHAEGTVDIVVTNPSGESARLSAAFRYTRLALTDVSPAQGLIGTFVRIRGLGIVPEVVTFGGTASAHLVLQDSTFLFAVAPPHASGTVDVAVTNANGQTAMLPGAFTYHDVTLTTSATVVAPNAALTVSWVVAAGQSPSDWIGLYRVGDPNTSNKWNEYTKGATSGSFTITAPITPGQYEFRYLVDDGFDDAARSGPITVAAPTGPLAAHGGSR